ncbi:MAG: sulfite exporter TauE/SafE family protein [Candidatus Dormiibacterota bacterium]
MSWGDAAAVVGGLAAGLLSGTIGVGGGIIFVPFMTVGYGLSQTLAQGTSLAAIIPTAIVGGVTHIRERNVVRDGAIWMGAAGVAGAILGAFVAVHVPTALLARVFAVVLILNAGVLTRRAIWPPAKSES